MEIVQIFYDVLSAFFLAMFSAMALRSTDGRSPARRLGKFVKDTYGPLWLKSDTVAQQTQLSTMNDKFVDDLGRLADLPERWEHEKRMAHLQWEKEELDAQTLVEESKAKKAWAEREVPKARSGPPKGPSGAYNAPSKGSVMITGLSESPTPPKGFAALSKKPRVYSHTVYDTPTNSKVELFLDEHFMWQVHRCNGRDFAVDELKAIIRKVTEIYPYGVPKS